jgi:hypothetical protein
VGRVGECHDRATAAVFKHTPSSPHYSSDLPRPPSHIPTPRPW